MNPSERLDAAIAEYYRSVESGQPLAADDLVARYPDLGDELRSFLSDNAAIEKRVSPVLGTVRYFGDYELLAEIARGGMGVVYRARQVKLDRIVALKMILAGNLASQEDVQRFHLEATMAANLQHKNIVAIHEVGEHNGQHYFSMDFIAGRSLADLVRDQPLPATQAIRYVRIVAEAIAFAHEQGVLHRDLKPSNILVDAQDQPHVTDFGLAKKLQGGSDLTATGAVVGTPSYMPPEQASGAALGPAADVYSLGAVLYELVTGRPPFRAATQLETLLQVLNAEPAAPRVLNPAISRDLETVLLKALAKDPGKRYASAQALGDDLQALLDGEPIKARRPSWRERTGRWFRKERRSVTVAARAVLVVLVLLGFGVTLWSLLLRERQGRVFFDTQGPALFGELEAAEREDALTRFRAPHQDPLLLRPGSYRVRLSAPGLLSASYQLAVVGNDQTRNDVWLGDRQFRDPVPETTFDTTVAVLEFRATSDLIVADHLRMTRLDGATQKPRWEIAFTADGKKGRPFRMALRSQLGDLPADLVRPAPDLDGDGVGDLLWTSDKGHCWALSGKDGGDLWFQSGNNPLLCDIQGKGAEDVIVTHDVIRGHKKADARLEALNGTNGQTLWTYPLRERHALPRAWLVDGGKVVVLDQGRLIEIQPKSGTMMTQHVLGFRLARPPVFADLDGDGAVDALYQRREGNGNLILGCWSLAASKKLWEYPLDMTCEVEPQVSTDRDGKVLVVLLNGQVAPPEDPIHESAATPSFRTVPDTFDIPKTEYDHGSHSGRWAARHIDCLDGATGERRWRYQPELGGVSLLHVGTGAANQAQLRANSHMVFALARRTLSSQGPSVGTSMAPVVFAISSHDGQLRWHRTLPVPSTPSDSNSESLPYGLAGWWSGLLVVRVSLPREVEHPEQHGLYFLTTDTGRVEHTMPGVTRFLTADLTGDGLDDLAYRYLPGRYHRFKPPEWRLQRGGPPVAWRRLGRCGDAIGDLDGDGVADLLSTVGNQVLAISGRNGRSLWPTPQIAQSQIMTHSPVDVDGDGHDDALLVGSTGADSLLRAVSGKTGKQLWRVSKLSEGERFSRGQEIACRDLDGDGKPEILFFYRTQQEGWLAVIDRASGAVLWNARAFQSRDLPRWAVADLDGDGASEVLLLTGEPMRLEVRQGITGKSLAEHRLTASNPEHTRLPCVHLSAGAKARDGTRSVMVALPRAGELVEFGLDGERRRFTNQKIASTDHFAQSNSGPLLTLRSKQGETSAVVVARHEDRPGQPFRYFLGLAFLDGKDLRPAFERELSQNQGANRLCDVHAADMDGDGTDEVVLMTKVGVEAVRTNGETLWTWPLPDGMKSMERIHAILPAERKQSATVVVHGGNMVFGLAGHTGKPVWRCETGSFLRLLATSGTQGRPFVVTDEVGTSVTLGMRVLPVDDSGRYQPGADHDEAVDATNSETRGRPLPWANFQLDRARMFGLAPFVILLVLCLLRGDWFNLLRLCIVVGFLTGAWALFQLAESPAGLTPAQGYDSAGWYRVFIPATSLVGIILLPIVILQGLMRLAGWRGRWLYWVVAPALLGVLFCFLPVRKIETPAHDHHANGLLLTVNDTPAHKPHANGLLLAVLVLVFLAPVLLGMDWLRRRKSARTEA